MRWLIDRLQPVQPRNFTGCRLRIPAGLTFTFNHLKRRTPRRTPLTKHFPRL